MSGRSINKRRSNLRGSVATRGLTLLESVLAATVLALVIAGVTGAVGFMTTDQRRDERRLGAMELAHRIVLQHLDDDQALAGQQGLPIDYGGARYRWDLKVQKLEVDTEGPEVERDEARAAFGRFRRVSVRVWLREESGGSTIPVAGVPRAELSRVYDILPMRNPDSFSTMLETERGIQDLIQALTGPGS